MTQDVAAAESRRPSRYVELTAYWLVALSAPAALLLDNGFPWVFWDTSEYLVRWLGLHPGVDRPIFYSLWLALFHRLPHGLFAVALSQTAAVAGAIRWLGSRIGGFRGRILSWTILVLFLASPSLLHAVTLMPDVAALVAAALVGVLATGDSMRTAMTAAAILALVSLSNYSLIPTSILVAAAIAAMRLGPARRAVPTGAGLLVVAAIVLLGLSWNWWLAGGGFAPRTASTVFIAARLHEAGVLADSLEEVGPSVAAWNGESAAAVRELRAAPRQVAWFLWGPSPLNRDGQSWRYEMSLYEEVEARWRPAVRAAIRRRPGPFLRSGWRNTRTMLRGDGYLAGFVPHRDGSGVHRMLTAVWPEAAPLELASRQSSGETVPKPLSGLYDLWRRSTLPGACAVAALLLISLGLRLRRRGGDLAVLVFALAAFYLANAALCGLLSEASSRYVERLACVPAWCLVLVGAMLLEARAASAKSDRTPS